jgi:GNAT superfamily N-acetyltransferase
MSGGITIRFATVDDCALVLQFIRELAEYERLAEEVVASEDDIRRHGFGAAPRFETLIAEIAGEPAGFALFYPDFSTFLGAPGIYLEDIFVREWARRRGVGRRLITRLAAIVLERGWSSLHFNVLDWNPARGFYQRLGFTWRQEWLPHSATGAALRRLAAEDRPDAD